MDYMFFGCPSVAFDLRENRFSRQGAAVYVTPNSKEEMATENRRAPHERVRQNTSIGVENSVPQLLNANE